MKTKLLIALCLSLFFSYITFKLGENKGSNKQFTKEVEHLQYEIAHRYMLRFGSPQTESQQCNLDYIVYNEVLEDCE